MSFILWHRSPAGCFTILCLSSDVEFHTLAVGFHIPAQAQLGSNNPHPQQLGFLALADLSVELLQPTKVWSIIAEHIAQFAQLMISK